MNPTHNMNTTAITSANILNDFRYFPINPMNTGTVLPCSITSTDGVTIVTAAGVVPTAMQTATLTTASGSLLHVIPMHIAPTPCAAGTAVSSVPQMAIIADASSVVATAVESANTRLASYHPQQTAPNTFNVLVSSDAGPFVGHTVFGGPSNKNNVTGLANIGNVSLQPVATSSATYILPTTTISSVPINNQDLVKEIVVGPTAAAAETTLIRTQLTSQQQQHKEQMRAANKLHKKQMKIIDAAIQQLPVPAANYSHVQSTNSNTMTVNRCNNNKLERNVSTFTLPADVAFSKIVPATYAGNRMSTHASPELLAVAASPAGVTQISSSVTLTLANQTNTTTKKITKPADVVCFSLEKSDTDNQGHLMLKKAEVEEATKQQRSTNTKQESLLKSKPVRRIIMEQTSPRTKRSKSLNNDVIPIEENAATERRRSEASEGNTKQFHVPKRIESTKCEIDIDITKNKKSEETTACVAEEIVSMDETVFEEEYLEDDSDEKSSNTSAVLTNVQLNEVRQNSGNGIVNDNTDQVKHDLEVLQKEIETVSHAAQQSNHTEKNVIEIKVEPDLKYDENMAEKQKQETVMKEDTELISKQEPISVDKSLFCDEQILLTSSSSTSSVAATNDSINETNSNAVTSTNISTTVTSTISTNSTKSSGTAVPSDKSFSTVLEMLSTFNMLSWKDGIGAAQNTNLRFQLNEFNLLQIYERCPPRYQIHTAYEKPIYERESHSIENTDPFLYLCRRCNCHGPAADFLAPEFCSLECLKRDTRKRQRDLAGIPTKKRPRKEALQITAAFAAIAANNPQPPQIPLKTQANQSLLVKKFFRWSTYLAGKYGEIAAPVDLFLNPFPTGPNCFAIGMKLEAIDPENCSLFCVCTVIAIQGYRLNLAFDGYDPMYNFWVNADSMDIFPPGWCAKTNRILQPPHGIDASKFTWPAYFAKEKAIPAPRQLFTHLNSAASPMSNPFKIGMHLEAEDLNDTGKLCVATVSDVLDDRIRIHFNGWDDCYDYWVDTNSPYIHPCGWHEGRQQLIVPPDFENSAFSWPEFLQERGSGLVAPATLFTARDPIDFKPKMKLEVVDPRNPTLIRPATVVARKGHRIKLHLEMWPTEFCFWLEDDSPDLHPIGWCDATGHDLEPPPGFQSRVAMMPCGTVGCRGIGNAKRYDLNTHSTRDCCPYTPDNWSAKVEKMPRVENLQIERKVTAKAAHFEQQNAMNKQKNEVLRPRRNNDQKSASAKPTINTSPDSIILERYCSLDSIKTVFSTKDQPKKQQKVEFTEEEDNMQKLFELRQELKDEVGVITEDRVNASLKLNDTGNVDASLVLQIAKEYLCDYGPRLQQNFNIWQHNLNANFDDIKKNPLHWTTKESTLFVEKLLNCSKTAHAFAREDIDGAALLDLQQSDLTDLLDIKFGPAVKLYAHILQLRTWTVAKFNVKPMKSLLLKYRT